MRVSAVHKDPAHRFSKLSANRVRLVRGLGIEGDAHAGVTVQHRSRVRQDPSQPNLRQVHLLHAELLDDLREKGYLVLPGGLGENVTTRGVDLLGLPVGTVVHLGPRASVTLTGLRNPCRQIDALGEGLLRQVVRRRSDGTVARLAGVMAVVAASGVVRPGDAIRLDLPPRPHTALGLV